VTQADPYKPLALFRTQVDMLFSFIAEPSPSSASGLENSLATLKGAPQRVGTVDQSAYDEEDDYELQKALQASLRPDSDIGGYAQHADVSISPNLPTPTAEMDPVAASMQRNRVLLQRMREEQEYAQRELWSDTELSSDEQAALEERRATLQQQEEEEERALRRVIEESEALARQHAEQMGTGRVQSQPQPSLPTYTTGPPTVQTPPIPSLTDPDSDPEDGQMPETVLPEEVVQEPTVEEIRQARLARFAQ